MESGGGSSTTGSEEDAESRTDGTGSTTAASTSADDTVGTTGAQLGPQVLLETSLGDIVIELAAEEAPITTANFLAYVESGFYDGEDGEGETIFHRVIPGFMIQGGGLTETLTPKATMPPIVNESGNGLPNLRGTVAMARTNDPDSATSQFFINHVDNTSLEGYAVFGEVIEGMDVVDAIAQVETSTQGQYMDVPVVPVVIMSATVL